MKIDSGLLSGKDVFSVPSVRHGLLAADLKTPLGIIWHWTGGPCTNPRYAQNLANSIRTYDRAKDRPASWHVLIAKDGKIYQSVPFTRSSWHVGRPGRIGGLPKQQEGKWNALAWDGRLFANVNSATVGVELENAGKLEQVGDKFFCWPYRTGNQLDARYEIPANRAEKIEGEWFDEFPEAQVEAAEKLLSTLALEYKWTTEVAQYGHFMFDAGRKEDPGPLWQQKILPEVLRRVFNPNTPEEN